MYYSCLFSSIYSHKNTNESVCGHLIPSWLGWSQPYPNDLLKSCHLEQLSHHPFSRSTPWRRFSAHTPDLSFEAVESNIGAFIWISAGSRAWNGAAIQHRKPPHLLWFSYHDFSGRPHGLGFASAYCSVTDAEVGTAGVQRGNVPKCCLTVQWTTASEEVSEETTCRHSYGFLFWGCVRHSFPVRQWGWVSCSLFALQACLNPGNQKAL